MSQCSSSPCKTTCAGICKPCRGCQHPPCLDLDRMGAVPATMHDRPQVVTQVPAVSSGIVKFAKDVVAGTIGGIAVTAVGHPFDTVKVRLQTQSMANPVYSGALDCFKKTIKWEGIPGLYKGVSSPLAGQMFFRATLFSTFGASKRWLGTNADGTTRELTTADFFKAGAITGFAASFFESPIDFYKSQIQVQIIRSKTNPNYKPPYTSVLQCVRATLATSGWKGPFQGLSATLARDVPANAVYLGSFEVFKRQVAEAQGVAVRELTPPVVMACGGIAGVLYWLAIFPLDVVKSAMMTDSIDPATRQYPNMAATFKKLYAEGGVPRLFRGFSPCLMRAVPANGVMLFTVDKMTQLLNPHH